mgnify:CR=1 FL=1
MTALGLEESDAEWKETILQSRFTYYPVYQEDQDDIVGVLNTKDYFRLEDRSRENILAKAVEKPYYVPETMKADVLFRNMKKEHQQFAVVLDEYGGLCGVITIKDLIEELVGDLEDDVPEEETVQPIVKLADDLWQAEGSVLLEELSEALGLPLESEEYDTLNGLIFHHLGTTPEVDAQVELSGLHIQVSKVDEFVVETALLRKLSVESPEEEK